MTWMPGIKLQDMEDQAIVAALDHFNGNRAKAAEELGITYRTIARKIITLRARGFDIAPAKKNHKASAE